MAGAPGKAEAEGGSVARVRAALREAGHPDEIREFPEGTRSAADAAAAVGCTVGQIAKSVVFRGVAPDGAERPVLVVASGAHPVDPAKLAALTGLSIHRADGAWVRQVTGFAIGGVAPLGHATAPVVVVDEALFAHQAVWAAAGSPRHVFASTAQDLLRVSGGIRGVVAPG
ncbi:YbaK/EbsC family protein [Roseomonas sp. SSH11]|uniref:YbaK/EbsC family protein n=1 Tax=Pararoseomonas baculiformis TaxID=2820812 RepID=A0ABS4A8G5_9PROT|nr:YbaK/EbsC family protein [Pararoseomonas baculiformis]MBP0443284.1 YbaK/EbsC family protein [Pararoseomonas baculiformis]